VPIITAQLACFGYRLASAYETTPRVLREGTLLGKWQETTKKINYFCISSVSLNDTRLLKVRISSKIYFRTSRNVVGKTLVDVCCSAKWVGLSPTLRHSVSVPSSRAKIPNNNEERRTKIWITSRLKNELSHCNRFWIFHNQCSLHIQVSMSMFRRHCGTEDLKFENSILELELQED
jgi:hypothetical protein